jgi:hypothetical protein
MPNIMAMIINVAMINTMALVRRCQAIIQTSRQTTKPNSGSS